MTPTLPNSTIRLFLFFLSSYRINIFCLLVLIIIYGMIPSIDSILLKKIINLIESYEDDVADLVGYMLFWAVLYGLWWETINVIGRLYDYIYMKTMPRIKGKVLKELYSYVEFHDHKFFQENLAGQLTNIITETSRSLEMVFSILNEKIIHKLAMVSFAVATMYSVHYELANVFLIWVVLFVTVSVVFAKKINRYSTAYAKSKANVAGKIVDSIVNINSVRIFTSHKFERKYLEGYVDTAVKNNQRLEWFMFKLRYVLGISCSLMIFTIIYYLITLRSKSAISVGDCVLVLSLCVSVANQIWDLTQEIGDMFEEFGSFNQVMSLMKPYSIVDVDGAKILRVTKGAIEFKNVTFNYRHNSNLFHNKSVLIKGQQRVGLVGFSGSGKTTFVNLILRLYDINSGRILIDGQDIKEVKQNSLRQNISVIPQEPVLFHRSIIENIRYGNKDAPDYEVMKAAQDAHIHDIIKGLPEGYDTLCGERGNNLSGGQRQRIMIARAILKNAPILILDEATSSLDSSTEHLIQQSLNLLMKDKTVLVIAHRLSTLLNMDRILVFEHGRIIGDGTHEDLVRSNQLYKKLWSLQSGGLIPENP